MFNEESESSSVDEGPVIRLGPWAQLLTITPERPTLRLLTMGRSGMGKTTLSVAVACRLIIPYIQRVILICPSAQSQLSFGCILEHVASKDLHVSTTSNELFRSILESVRTEWGKSNGKTRTLLFMDDIAGDFCTNQGRKGDFANLLNESNHIGLSVIGIFQQASGCSSVLRDNTENIIIFPPSREDDIKVVYREFIPYQYSKEKRQEAIDAATEVWDDGEFVFIHRPPRSHGMMFRGFDEKIVI